VTIAHAQVPAQPALSPFTGADVCRQAGLTLPEGTRRPVFDDDCWDLTDVIGLPVSLSLKCRRFNFTEIPDDRWRLVAKELIMALLGPHHEAVAALSRAYRTPHHVSTCNGRLDEIIRFFKWLTVRGVPSLEDLNSGDCDAYLAHRRYQRDDGGATVGERGSGTRRLAALIVTDLLNYRELFTADRVPPACAPGPEPPRPPSPGTPATAGAPTRLRPSRTRSSGPRWPPPCTWCAFSALTLQNSPRRSGTRTGVVSQGRRAQADDGGPRPRHQARAGRVRACRAAPARHAAAPYPGPDQGRLAGR
jgi:hypothetical protein